MAERDSFMPGACTVEEKKDIFQFLDAGGRDAAVIHTARQVCMTTCVQFDACNAQADIITLELQKSGVEATVVAGSYVQPSPLSKDVLASTEMFKMPILTWEKGWLPEDPGRALSILRVASLAGQVGLRIAHWNKNVAAPIADMKVALKDVVHLPGLAEKEAEHAARWVVRMYAEYMDMQERSAFSIEEKQHILGIAGIFAQDVRRLQDLNFRPSTKLAAYLSADYCEWLWDTYSERWSITPGKFRALLLRRPAYCVEMLDAYIASRPRTQRVPGDVRLHLSGNAQEPRRKRASAEAAEKAHMALSVFADNEYFTPGFLKELAGHGPRAMQEAEAYLSRVKAAHSQVSDQKINIPISLLREAVFRSTNPPTDRETLEALGEAHRLKMVYRSDNYIRPWMTARAVEKYSANRYLMTERVRYLIRWGFAKETQDLYEAGKYSWQCTSQRGPRALIPTQAFLEMPPDEQACLIHAFDLGPFFGERPMSLTAISRQWNVEDPAAVGRLLAPYIDAPPDTNGQGLAAHWERYRHKALRGHDAAKNIAGMDETYFESLYAKILWKDPRIKGQYDFVESAAFKRGARWALGYMHSLFTENQYTLRAYARRLRHPLREADRLADLSITEEERYIYALCYGAEYFRRLVAYGSSHLVQRMREQAYTILGISGVPKEPISFCETRRPVSIPKRECEPQSSRPSAKSESVSRPRPAKAPRVVEYPVEQPHTYQSVHDLPDPERAAVYIVHAAMTHFTFTMRKQRWHDPQKVLEHFGLATRAELVAHVRSNILPFVRKPQLGL